jgi:hypothetical protein
MKKKKQGKRRVSFFERLARLPVGKQVELAVIVMVGIATTAYYVVSIIVTLQG